MSSHLEQFINDHREEFDSQEPSPKVWEGIDQDLVPGQKVKMPARRIELLRWSVAAAVIIGVAAGIWYFAGAGNGQSANNLAVKNKIPAAVEPKSKDIQTVPQGNASKSDRSLKDSDSPAVEPIQSPDNGDDESNFKEELYHFAKLVEIKHKELRRIERDEPLLYLQFAGDVNKLDSVYHSLQLQLTNNPNREKLLEAMIQNLQLQMKLLNHQLDIIKQINHSKKSEYENAYKSI